MRQPSETMRLRTDMHGNNDLYTLMTVIAHLMTCYAFRPCKPIADNINLHLQHLLNSPSKELLGEWAENFSTLLKQWQVIAEHHERAAGIDKTEAAQSRLS
ncbi:MAG: hypothetical protein ACU85E_13160 [Gammaproteobacteria bacterium]